MLIRKEGGSTHYTRLPSGELLSQRTPAGTHYYLIGRARLVVGMTDVTGSINARYSYRSVRERSDRVWPLQPVAVKSG